MSNEAVNDAVLQRLHALEAALQHYQQQSQPDPHIKLRATPFDLQPYEEFYEILPNANKDFFRSPLPETERRNFLAKCPTNLDRQYRPPSFHVHNVGTLTKRFDQKLADIQYRLTGLTRPMDLMAHNLAQHHTVSPKDATDFLQTLHSFLADVASHITQVRTDNVCRDTGLTSVPIQPDLSPTDQLLDIERILEQTKLNNALQDVQRKGRLSQKRKGKRHTPPRGNEALSHTNVPPISHNSSQQRSSDHNNNNNTRGNNNSIRPRPSTSSRHFQQRQ